MPIIECEAQVPIPPNPWNALHAIDGVIRIEEKEHSYNIIVDDSADINSIIEQARQLGLDAIKKSE